MISGRGKCQKSSKTDLMVPDWFQNKFFNMNTYVILSLIILNTENKTSLAFRNADSQSLEMS